MSNFSSFFPHYFPLWINRTLPIIQATHFYPQLLSNHTYNKSIHNPFPHSTNLQKKTSRYTKIWKFSKNKGTIILNKVEDILANGEIAHYEQFLLWPQCFKSRLQQRRTSESVYMWERYNKMKSYGY